MPQSTQHGSPSGGYPAITVIGVQLLVVALSAVLFVAVGHWQGGTSDPAGLAALLGTGALLGLLFSLALHEWSHYAGARLMRAHMQPVTRLRLFVFNWDFRRNSTTQFLVMSGAGTAGSALAIALLALTLAPRGPGGMAAVAAASGGLIFAGIIEWPVLLRVMRGAEPLAALQAIGRRTVTLGASAGIVTAVLCLWLVLP